MENLNRSFTEVLELINNIPDIDREKIPKEYITALTNNADTLYDFYINKNKSLREQNISKEAYAIFVKLYIDYIADENKKETIEEILELNSKKSK